MKAFFDTNVLVYVYDRADARKQAIAQGVLADHWRAGSLVISTQVLQEFYSAVLKRQLVMPVEALALVRELATCPVVSSSPDFVVAALTLAQRHRLSVWDSLIVQAAITANCDVLLTEDLQAGQRFGAVEVINPFSLGAHEALLAPRARAKRGPRSAARQG